MFLLTQQDHDLFTVISIYMYTCNKVVFVYIGPEMFQVPKYLAHVDRRLKEENDRLLHYLDQSTR